MSLFSVGDGLMVMSLFAWVAGFPLIAVIMFVLGLAFWWKSKHD